MEPEEMPASTLMPMTRLTLAALLTLAGLGGCVQAPTVHGEWQAGAKRGEPYSRVLVVGVSHNLKNRCAFERYLAGQLQGDATEAWASCDSIDKNAREPLTRESIEAAVAARKADAVIATVLVAQDMQAVQGGGRDTRGTAGYKATDAGWSDSYYGVYGVPVIYGEFKSTSEVTTLQADVTVASRVFETQGARVVYALETRARRLESRAEGLSSLTGPIAEQLRRDGLVR
jgi:hypothetical protein